MDRRVAAAGAIAAGVLALAALAQLGIARDAASANAAPLQARAAQGAVDRYKVEVARLLAQSNSASIADSLPPILKSIVVLDITVGADGHLERVTVWRSNGYKELERAAVDSLRRLGSAPPPPAPLLGGASSLRFLETWLFRPDGRFQVRSIASDAPLQLPTVVVEQERSY